MEKLFKKVGRERYNLHQMCSLQHNVLRFTIVNFLQESCNDSSERPCCLGGGLTIGDNEFTWITQL